MEEERLGLDLRAIRQMLSERQALQRETLAKLHDALKPEMRRAVAEKFRTVTRFVGPNPTRYTPKAEEERQRQRRERWVAALRLDDRQQEVLRTVFSQSPASQTFAAMQRRYEASVAQVERLASAFSSDSFDKLEVDLSPPSGSVGFEQDE